jgi:hypothetical protein
MLALFPHTPHPSVRPTCRDPCGSPPSPPLSSMKTKQRNRCIIAPSCLHRTSRPLTLTGTSLSHFLFPFFFTAQPFIVPLANPLLHSASTSTYSPVVSHCTHHAIPSALPSCCSISRPVPVSASHGRLFSFLLISSPLLLSVTSPALFCPATCSHSTRLKHEDATGSTSSLLHVHWTSCLTTLAGTSTSLLFY